MRSLVVELLRLSNRCVASSPTLSRGRVWRCVSLLSISILASRAQDLSLSSTTVTSGTASYQAPGTITASNGFSCGGSASVTFTAGSQVVLQPGFQAVAGTAPITFHAIIAAISVVQESASETGTP